MGGLGILCQLGATVSVRTELGDWLPGLADDADTAAVVTSTVADGE
jgi:hypothetical protein